ncbi:MAG: acyl-ACP thioesterase [Mailhella sp.]|nr:acyl-ACP thioesterase [Mailhella sp.]
MTPRKFCHGGDHGDIVNLYEMPLTVRYGEVGPDGLTSLSSLGNWLQEAAGLSADTLHFGSEQLFSRGLTWILMRLVLRLFRLPRIGEHLNVLTWPSKMDHFGFRGYAIYDEGHACLAKGGSAWAVMETASRSIVSLPDDLRKSYPDNASPCDDFSCRVLPRVKNNVLQSSFLRVRHDDLDINRHVNNTRYLAWIMEPVSREFLKQHHLHESPSLIDVSFRAECFPQDELASVFADCGQPESLGLADTGQFRCFSHAIRKLPGGQDVCRAISAWKTDRA